jgi:hypothetical protein
VKDGPELEPRCLGSLAPANETRWMSETGLSIFLSSGPSCSSRLISRSAEVDSLAMEGGQWGGGVREGRNLRQTHSRDRNADAVRGGGAGQELVKDSVERIECCCWLVATRDDRPVQP